MDPATSAGMTKWETSNWNDAMTTTALKPVSKSAGGAVGEFVVEARLDALNNALAARGLDASRIITIFELPGQPVANALPARYRVLFRTP
jgi:hypothetical protein